MLSRQKQNDLIEQARQQRAWARALAVQWHTDPGERATIENLLVSEALKGSGGSGNWAHESETRIGLVGGSDPGGGLGAIGAETDSSVQERQTAAQSAGDARRERRKKPKRSRPKSANEARVGKELSEARGYMAAVGSDSTEHGPVKEYADQLDDWLANERAMNDALYDVTGLGPEEATASEWGQVADRLHREGYDLYKRYDLQGIAFQVDEMRGAREDPTASLVGGQWVICKRGAFSRAKAAKVKATMWGDAKDLLADEMGKQLTAAGFGSKEIADTTYKQRQNLLRELGGGRIETTRSGRPARIGKVPRFARQRVINTSSYRIKANAARTALDPVDTPTVGAYRKLQIADLIRMRYLPTAEGGEISPLNF